MIPPRPEPLAQPRLGLLWFARVAHSWLDALTVKSYHMLLGQFRLPGMRVFVVNDPAWVERMLIAEPHNYPKHRLMHEALEPLLGSSPFTTNGPLWQRQRRMLDQAFGHARLGRVFGLMQQACNDMQARLQAGTLDVDGAMTHVTADIVHRTIFSLPLLAQEADTLFGAFTRYQQLAQRAVFLKLLRLPPLWLNRSKQRQAAIIRGFLAARVRERFASRSTDDEAQGADILAGLRSAVDPQDGSRLSETEVLDQICMLFLAGHETSASALSWCLYLLAESSGLQQTLRDEVAATTQGEPLQAGDVRKLVQLHALFREVLRLYPPVGYFPREAVADQVIRGSQVRRGDALLVFPWLLHRHRRFWVEPDAFEPGRFDSQGSADPPKGTYLPFGMGARACIGAGFAMQEAALILSTLLQHHCLRPAPGPAPRVVGRLTVRSADGIRVQLEALHAGAAHD
ncbi:MAG: cytochrome P450 [Hydrogenophaga sp.]|uniref:cytochrome P450 n=1 Tax=Hydrogenophaga sp. TaxID=1904254 RepID=UPI0026020470|nr:cytochrome P450 [Hydrogenophaga sp.]MDM7942115.1 cytochrome P450 [Hydrogenophaga sp.]